MLLFISKQQQTLKGHCHKKVSQKSLLGDALDLIYELLTCLKIFQSTILKLRFFKSMFHQSKNALTHCPRPQLNLIPSAGLILLIDTRCAHARGLSSEAGPLVVCGRPIGDYDIIHGRLLSEKTAVEK
jgi:hypothetical protein